MEISTVSELQENGRLKNPKPIVILLVSFALILAIFTIYWQVHNHEFVDLDDYYFIFNNPHIQDGLTKKSIAWAFNPSKEIDQMGFWHPLTSLSLILDIELFGLNAGYHHLMNVAFHTVNTLLLMIAFYMMTGHFWPSAFVAAVFALHPQHVESVAWASERKDVLSILFWMLTLIAYTGYAKKPGVFRYLVTLFVFALGLMAKTMLVTIPFVLLLLDYWPLRRMSLKKTALPENSLDPIFFSSPFRQRSLGRLVAEKFPFFILSAAASAIIYYAQKSSGSFAANDILTLKLQIFNAVGAYVSYIVKFIFPFNLCVFYSLNTKILTFSRFIIGISFLGIISFAVLFFRNYRYLVVGWLWFLGTLVPVIGLVQIGSQAMADRYTYIPQTGLTIMMAWGIPELLRGLKDRRAVMCTSSILLLLFFSILAFKQIGIWRNSIRLFTHAVTVVQDNWYAHKLLAYTLQDQGQYNEAIEHYKKAQRIHPSLDIQHSIGRILLTQGKFEDVVELYQNILPEIPENATASTVMPVKYSKEYEAMQIYTQGHTVMGTALEQKGELEKAEKHFREALRILPTSAAACQNLARVLVKLNRYSEAISFYEVLLQANHVSAEMYTNYGISLMNTGRKEDAVSCFENAIHLEPGAPTPYFYLGEVFFSQAQIDKAIEQYRTAASLSHEWTGLQDKLARLMASCPQSRYFNPPEALRLSQTICEQVNYQYPEPMDTLAIAYASNGDFSQAKETAVKAIQLAQAAGREALAREIRDRLDLYEKNQAYRLPGPENNP